MAENAVYRTKKEMKVFIAAVGGSKSVVLPADSILIYSDCYKVYSVLITAVSLTPGDVQTDKEYFEEVVI